MKVKVKKIKSDPIPIPKPSRFANQHQMAPIPSFTDCNSQISIAYIDINYNNIPFASLCGLQRDNSFFPPQIDDTRLDLCHAVTINFYQLMHYNSLTTNSPFWLSCPIVCIFGRGFRRNTVHKNILEDGLWL